VARVLSPAKPAPPATVRRLRLSVRSIDVIAALLALLLAIFVVIGASFQATDSTAWFTSSPGAAAGNALAAVAITVVLYVLISIVYAGLDRHWAGYRQAGVRVIPMRRAMAQWFLPTFSVLVVVWLAWLLLHYPGNVDSDTSSQLLQWLGFMPRVNHHPWFDTVIFGWFWEIGRAVSDYNVGLFVFLVFQVTATALGMSLVLTYLGRLGLSGRWRRILTAFAALFPVFAIQVSVMSKDNFAAILWLPFLVLFVETVRTRGRVLCRPWVGAGAVVLAIPLVLARRPNVYVFILCVVVLLIISVWGARKRLLIGAALVLVLTSLVWPRVVLPSLGVRPGTATDMLSIPVQQTARTVVRHGDSIPASERAAIDAVLRYDGLADVYTPRRSDPVKARWNNDATTAQKLAYARVWLAQLKRYPGTYVAATVNSTFPFFAPVAPAILPRNLNQRRYVDFFLARSVDGTTRQQIEQVLYDLHPLPALNTARTAVDRVTVALLSANLVASMAFYCSWIPLLVLGFAARRRSPLLALATVPLFVNLLILIAGPLAGERYTVPMIMGSVLLVGLTMVPVSWLGAGEPETGSRAAKRLLSVESGRDQERRPRRSRPGDITESAT
jgi:hypothetical protein